MPEILAYRRRMGLCEYCGQRPAENGFQGCLECDPVEVRCPSERACKRCSKPRDRADREQCTACLAAGRRRTATWRSRGLKKAAP